MPLPTFNPTPFNPNAPGSEETAPPGQRPFQQGRSTFSTMARQISQDINQQFSVIPNVQQGLYGAFGNNAFTRTAAGAVGSIGDAFDTLINGPRDPSEDLTETDKLLTQQLEVLKEVQKGIDTLSTSKDTSEVLDGLVKVIREGNDRIGSDIQSLKVDLGAAKGSLTSTEAPLKLGKVKHRDRVINSDKKKDPVGNALELKTNGPDKGQIQVLNQLKDSKAFLKNISMAANKILEVLTAKDPNAHANEPDDSGPPGLLGNLKEKVKREDGPSGLDGIGEAEETNPGILGGILGGITGVGGFIKSGAKNLVSKGLHFLKGTAEKVGDKLGDLGSRASKFGGQVLEKGKGLLENIKVPKIISEAAEKVNPKALLGGLGNMAKGALKVIPGLGTLVTAGLTAKDAYEAGSNAEDILDIKDRKATTGEKIEAGVGGALEGLSFGLIDKKKSAKWIDNLFSSKPEDSAKKINEITPKPAAPAAGSPSSGAPVTNIQSKTETNNYVTSRRAAKNDDDSFNRYLDKTYTF